MITRHLIIVGGLDRGLMELERYILPQLKNWEGETVSVSVHFEFLTPVGTESIHDEASITTPAFKVEDPVAEQLHVMMSHVASKMRRFDTAGMEICSIEGYSIIDD